MPSRVRNVNSDAGDASSSSDAISSIHAARAAVTPSKLVPAWAGKLAEGAASYFGLVCMIVASLIHSVSPSLVSGSHGCSCRSIFLTFCLFPTAVHMGSPCFPAAFRPALSSQSNTG